MIHYVSLQSGKLCPARNENTHCLPRDRVIPAAFVCRRDVHSGRAPPVVAPLHQELVRGFDHFLLSRQSATGVVGPHGAA